MYGREKCGTLFLPTETISLRWPSRPTDGPLPVEITKERSPSRTSIIVETDTQDYQAGETAIITASGFDVAETVEVQVLHMDDVPNTGEGHDPWQVTDGGEGDLDGLTDGRIKQVGMSLRTTVPTQCSK